MVDLALEEADNLLGEYIDIDYFTNLKYLTEVLVDSMQKLSLRVSSNNEYTETVDKEQYATLTVSISNIFDDLSTEEYNVFKELAKDDEDITEFLDMVDNGFEEYKSDSKLSRRTATANVAKLSDGIMVIGSIYHRKRYVML